MKLRMGGKKRKRTHSSSGSDSDSDSDSGDTHKHIRPVGRTSCVGNHLFFYDEINEKTAFWLRNAISILTIRMSKTSFDTEHLKIYLHLNSEGGDLLSGFALSDCIRINPIPIECIVEGECASSATLLLLACPVRSMTKNSLLLIHQISSGNWGGKFEEIKEDFDNMKKMTRMLKRVYRDNTNLTDGDLSEILKHDLYYSARKCLKLGFIHKIL
jgi:ATP-dependent protease ClpP protease subunit